LGIRLAQTVTLMLEASVGVLRDNGFILECLFRQMAQGVPNTAAVNTISEAIFDHLMRKPSQEKLLPFIPWLSSIIPTLMGYRARGVQGLVIATPLTRARLFRIFKICLETAVNVRYPELVTHQMRGILPEWLDVYQKILLENPIGDITNLRSWDVLYLIQQVFESLPALVNTPFISVTFLGDMLTWTLRHLQAFYPAFRDMYLRNSMSPPEDTEHRDEPAHLPEIMYPAFGFISAAIRSRKAMAWFNQENTTALVEMIFKWSQMINEDEEDFLGRPELFVDLINEQEDICLRVCTFDVLRALSHAEPTVSVTLPDILLEGSSKSLRESTSDKEWKTLEASLAVLGNQAEFLTNRFERQHLHLDTLRQHLANFQPEFQSLSAGMPYLQGRLLLYAGQYVSNLSAGLANMYLDDAIDLLSLPHVTMPVRFCALEMVKRFYAAPDQHPAVLTHKVAKAREVVQRWAQPVAGAKSMNRVARDALKAIQAFY